MAKKTYTDLQIYQSADLPVQQKVKAYYDGIADGSIADRSFFDRDEPGATYTPWDPGYTINRDGVEVNPYEGMRIKDSSGVDSSTQEWKDWFANRRSLGKALNIVNHSLDGVPYDNHWLGHTDKDEHSTAATTPYNIGNYIDHTVHRHLGRDATAEDRSYWMQKLWDPNRLEATTDNYRDIITDHYENLPENIAIPIDPAKARSEPHPDVTGNVEDPVENKFLTARNQENDPDDPFPDKALHNNVTQAYINILGRNPDWNDPNDATYWYNMLESGANHWDQFEQSLRGVSADAEPDVNPTSDFSWEQGSTFYPERPNEDFVERPHGDFNTTNLSTETAVNTTTNTVADPVTDAPPVAVDPNDIATLTTVLPTTGETTDDSNLPIADLVGTGTDTTVSNPWADGSNESFVLDLYVNELGRSIDEATGLPIHEDGSGPDTEGFNYWLDRLNSGQHDRDTVAHQIHGSGEGHRYRNSLTGTDTDTTDTDTTTTDSTEVDTSTWHPDLSNEDYISHLYKTLQGREPDIEGLTYWTHRLDSEHHDREFVYKYIWGSKEAKNYRESIRGAEAEAEAERERNIAAFNETTAKQDIGDFYQTYLGRDPDWNHPQGATYWLDKMRTGELSLDQVGEYVQASLESRQRIGVQNLWEELYNVSPTEDWLDTLLTKDQWNLGITGEADLENKISTTSGFSDWLKGVYSDDLGRDIKQKGAEWWTKDFLQGQSRDTILTSIRNSDEYTRRTGLIDLYNERYGENPSEAWIDSMLEGSEFLGGYGSVAEIREKLMGLPPVGTETDTDTSTGNPSLDTFLDELRTLLGLGTDGTTGTPAQGYGWGGYGGIGAGVAVNRPLRPYKNARGMFNRGGLRISGLNI